MDSFYIDPRDQNSRQCRSRSNSHLSTTAAQLQGLNITAADSTSENCGTASEPPTTAPATILEEGLHPSPKPFISAPVPQQFTPFPLLSEADLGPNWSYLDCTSSEEPTASTAPTPLLRFDTVQSPVRDLVRDQRSRAISNPANMSTLGIQQYDSRFDPSMQNVMRQSYTWPQFEVEQQFLNQANSGLSAGQLTPNLYDEPKFMSMYSRAVSDSPPRGSLTPEQRELKRQRDHARRDSKHQMRRERSTSNNSNPYICSQNTSPEMMPMKLENFPSSLTPSPLLSQGSLQSSPNMGANAFLAPYSPPLNDQLSTDLYGPIFAMGPNDFTTPAAFQMAYSNASDPTMQAFIGRPHSLSSASDQSVSMSMYRNAQCSPQLGTSDNGDHVRVVHSRPKPQCWEHGCNGRQFSTFSNLLRHQREKSGSAQKSSCPNCGAEFTRTTARNGHMLHDKCSMAGKQTGNTSNPEVKKWA